MNLLVLLPILIVASASRLPFDPQLNTHWENFKKVFGKTYSGSEEGARRLIWEGNVNQIINHNIAADMGKHSFKKGINEYADLTHEEFVRKLTGLVYTPKQKNNGSTWLPPANVQYPKRVDWREEGLVTGVKNQEDCGSCWAFSTTGSLEGQHKKKTGQLVSLSEQNLVDCSKPEGNNGCDGGLIDQAFLYIQKNNGIDTEESYPYTAKEGECRFDRSTVGATLTGFVDIPFGDENALMQAVATVGPVSGGIDASRENFRFYKSGVYDEPLCSSEELNHGILIVGYGTEDGKDYWLIKNSWGESWGQNGYIKMSRNKRNQCGIASMASFPLV